MAGDPLAPNTEVVTPDPAAAPLAPEAALGDKGLTAPSQPRTDVYTMMLIVSFIALTTACVLLYLELRPYGDWMQWWQVPTELRPS